MGIMKRLHRIGPIVLAILLAATIGVSQSPDQPVRAVPDPGIVTTLQSITPAGVQSVFIGRVYGVAFGDSSTTLYVALNSGAIYELNWRKQPGFEDCPRSFAPGNARCSAGSHHPRAAVERVVVLRQPADSHFRGRGECNCGSPRHVCGGRPSAAAEKNGAGERDAGVALTFNDALAVVDLASGKLKGNGENRHRALWVWR